CFGRCPHLLAGTGSATQAGDSDTHPIEGAGGVRAGAEGETALQGRLRQLLTTNGKGRLDRFLAVGKRVELATAPVLLPVRSAIESDDGGADVLTQPRQDLLPPLHPRP